MLRIAFLHYHLRPGGVTSVIKQQIKALSGKAECLVLCGQPQAGFTAPVVEVPGLAYDLDQITWGQDYDAATVVDEIMAAIKQVWPQGCDVIHIHNPTLIKNSDILEIIELLQERGENLLLQIHDFAEDGRPHCYAQEEYPVNVHYCAINRRDYRYLKAAGLDKGLHYLPNAVSVPAPVTDKFEKQDLFLYPVRGIRRKNIGEAVLLATFLPSAFRLAITLPPQDPQAKAAYQDWQQFAAQHKIAVAFDAGLHHDFTELMQSARAIVTTSITEGFGLGFLEPWTWKRYLLGRTLPEICVDFQASGVSLRHMYKKLKVPLAWFEEGPFKAEWHQAVRSAAQRYGYNVAHQELTKAWQQMVAQQNIDFGLLSEKYQREVISNMLRQKAQEHLLHLNPRLGHFIRTDYAPTTIEQNYQAVVRNFSLDKYQMRLLEIYEQTREITPVQKVDKKVLIQKFFDLNNFSLLKWQDYEF